MRKDSALKFFSSIEDALSAESLPATIGAARPSHRWAVLVPRDPASTLPALAKAKGVDCAAVWRSPAGPVLRIWLPEPPVANDQGAKAQSPKTLLLVELHTGELWLRARGSQTKQNVADGLALLCGRPDQYRGPFVVRPLRARGSSIFSTIGLPGVRTIWPERVVVRAASMDPLSFSGGSIDSSECRDAMATGKVERIVLRLDIAGDERPRRITVVPPHYVDADGVASLTLGVSALRQAGLWESVA